ncbi:hypothetical protein Tco_1146833 [Tanacetum coccineum]
MKKEEYDIWAMEMEHYLEYIDNEVWKVIQNGNSKKRISTGKDGIVRILSPVTAAEIQAVEKERKAKNILLMAIPKEHMRRFHGMDDAKEIWEAIRTRFGGNANSKKMQKAVFKQQFEAFKISNSEGLEKGYDRFQQLLSQLEAHGAEVSTEDANHKFLRSLPPAWSNWRGGHDNGTNPEIDTLSIDDLYNNLRVFEQETQGASKTSSSAQNVAFVSQATISTNKWKLVLLWNSVVGKPLYSRFSKTNDFKEGFSKKPEISDSDDNSSEHSTCQSNDSEGSCGNTSEHSFETKSESLSVPNEVSKSRLEVTNEKGNIHEEHGASEVTNSAGTLQTPSFNASEEKDEDVEIFVVPSTNFPQQEKKAFSTDTSEDNPKIQAFRRELEEIALKHLGKVSENTTTSTTSVNTGSEPVNTGSFDDDDSPMPELEIFHKSETGIFDEASYDEEGVITDFHQTYQNRI